MAIAGKQNDYTDERLSSPPTGLDANLGRMPVIDTGAGVSVGQGAALNYYIAASNDLLGSSVLEAAKIMELQGKIMITSIL